MPRTAKKTAEPKTRTAWKANTKSRLVKGYNKALESEKRGAGTLFLRKESAKLGRTVTQSHIYNWSKAGF